MIERRRLILGPNETVGITIGILRAIGLDEAAPPMAVWPLVRPDGSSTGRFFIAPEGDELGRVFEKSGGRTWRSVVVDLKSTIPWQPQSTSGTVGP